MRLAILSRTDAVLPLSSCRGARQRRCLLQPPSTGGLRDWRARRSFHAHTHTGALRSRTRHVPSAHATESGYSKGPPNTRAMDATSAQTGEAGRVPTPPTAGQTRRCNTSNAHSVAAEASDVPENGATSTWHVTTRQAQTQAGGAPKTEQHANPRVKTPAQAGGAPKKSDTPNPRVAQP